MILSEPLKYELDLNINMLNGFSIEFSQKLIQDFVVSPQLQCNIRYSSARQSNSHFVDVLTKYDVGNSLFEICNFSCDKKCLNYLDQCC